MKTLAFEKHSYFSPLVSIWEIKRVSTPVEGGDRVLLFGRATTDGIDLLGQLRADSPLIEPWGKEIAIEIRDQHAVTRRKHKDLQAINLTTVEIKLQKGMHLTHEQEADRSLIYRGSSSLDHSFFC
jgi:hypothetical protein